MIMDLEAYVEQRRAAGNGIMPVDGGKTVIALNHVADAAMLLNDLETAARELENPHLLESLRGGPKWAAKSVVGAGSHLRLAPTGSTGRVRARHIPLYPSACPPTRGDPAERKVDETNSATLSTW